MRRLGYSIDRRSKLVIITANGEYVHPLGKISALPVTIGSMTVETPVQVLDSSDEVLIIGNDWLNQMDAVLDWKKERLSITGRNTTVTVPVVCTQRKTTEEEFIESEDSTETESETETETESDSEFEEEKGTQAVPIYFFDPLTSVDLDLKYNPWTIEHEAPKYEKEESNETEPESSSDKEETPIVPIGLFNSIADTELGYNPRLDPEILMYSDEETDGSKEKSDK